MILVLLSLQTLNVFHSEFMTIGPSSHTTFMTVTIDTWGKWCMLSVATFLNACIADFMGDAIVPWIQNTVQDHKTKYIPYRKITCYCICQLWAVYCGVMSVLNVSLVMSQVDFVLMRLFADLLVNQITINKFIKHKVVDPTKYNLWNEERLAYVQMNGSCSDVNGIDVCNLQKEMVQPLNHYISSVE